MKDRLREEYTALLLVFCSFEHPATFAPKWLKLFPEQAWAPFKISGKKQNVEQKFSITTKEELT